MKIRRNIHKGYLPENYYKDQQVFGRNQPKLVKTRYPNKIELSAIPFKSFYALISPKGYGSIRLFEWMEIYSHVRISCDTIGRPQYTGKIFVEHYNDDDRDYEMVIFRLSTATQELSNPVGIPQGASKSGKPNPGPKTALLVNSGEQMSKIRVALGSYRDRFSNLTVPERISTTTVPATSENFATYRDTYWDLRNQNISDLERLGLNIQVQNPISIAINNSNNLYSPSEAPDYFFGAIDININSNSSFNSSRNNSGARFIAEGENVDEEFNRLPSYSEVAHETEYGQQWVRSSALRTTNV